MSYRTLARKGSVSETLGNYYRPCGLARAPCGDAGPASSILAISTCFGNVDQLHVYIELEANNFSSECLGNFSQATSA